MGKGKGKGFELETCLEHSRNRKTTSLQEPERERKESCRRDETEEKAEKTNWAGSCELLCDLGKHGKALDRGVQDLTYGDPGGRMKTGVHISVEAGTPEDRTGLGVAA